jgi:Fur family peroxide stress response transcriptional regulator
MTLNTSPHARLDQVTAHLKATGYRLTPQRLAILRALITNHQHPSVEQIYRQVRRDFPTTSLATIYNTLECLKGLGEVLELPLGGASRYDGRKPDPHAHLICTACGRIEDLDIDLAGTIQAVAQERGYAEIRQGLEFYGVCPACQDGSQIGKGN